MRGFCLWSFVISKRVFVIFVITKCISFFILCSLLCRGDCVWERSCELQVLSCNSSVEVSLWKVMCGHCEKPSVWRRGRRAVALTSKHYLVFAFGSFFSTLSYILCFFTLLILYICLVLFVWPHLCSTKRAFNSSSTLSLEESSGVVPEPFTENSGSLLVK